MKPGRLTEWEYDYSMSTVLLNDATEQKYAVDKYITGNHNWNMYIIAFHA